MKNILFIIPIIIGLTACAPNEPQSGAKQSSGDRSSHRPPRLNFADIDKNSDGKINLDEFTSAKPKSGGRRNRPEPSEIFNRIDSNKDGVITSDEFEQHSQQRPPRPPR